METKAKKVCLSLSGGMDSTSLLIRLLAEDKQIKVYSYFYNQRHQIELQRAKKNIEMLMEKFPEQLLSYEVIDVTNFFSTSKSSLTSDTRTPEGHYSADSQAATVVEGRNMVFGLSIFIKALTWAKENNEPVSISLATHQGDFGQYADCTDSFFLDMTRTLKHYDPTDLVDYYIPYQEKVKQTILEDALENTQKLGLDFDTVLQNSNTCYNPDSEGRACGRCGADVERVESFIAINRIDPVPYQEPWEEVVKNVKKVLAV